MRTQTSLKTFNYVVKDINDILIDLKNKFLDDQLKSIVLAPEETLVVVD